MDSYVAVSIAVAGWIATHILTLRAQTRNLRLQVLDRARGEATEALRAGQSWFSNLATTVMLADAGLHLEQQGMTPDWNSHVQKVLVLQHSVPTAWIMRLEEYEILFPDAAPVRERLVGRQRTIMSKTSGFLSQLMPSAFGKGSPASRQQTIAEALKWLPDVHDQASLMEDLIVHLQNCALQDITGRKVPARIPRDPNLPRIVKGADGFLWIEPDNPEPLVLHRDSKPKDVA